MNKPSDITSQHTQRIILFSDGTYLYAKDLGNMLYKYEPNGLDLILKGSVAFTGDLSFSTSDGSYIYAYVSSEKKIKRYNFSGGASVKEWSVPGVKDFFFIQNNHFITGSGVYSYRGVETHTGTAASSDYSVSSLMGLNFYDLGAVD